MNIINKLIQIVLFVLTVLGVIVLCVLACMLACKLYRMFNVQNKFIVPAWNWLRSK